MSYTWGGGNDLKRFSCLFAKYSLMVYFLERTIHVLMNASQDGIFGGPLPEVILPDTSMDGNMMELSGNCSICNMPMDLARCTHCSKAVCIDSCLKQCEQCEQFYCSFCSAYDYSQRYEKLYCFGCTEERAKQKKHQLMQIDTAE